MAGILSISLAPGSVQPLKLASPSEPSCLSRSVDYRFIRLYSLYLFLQNSQVQEIQESSPSFQDQDQAQVFKNKISSPRIKRGQEAQPLSANLKRGQRTHQKEAHSPLITATNMPTARSQSKAMSAPPISSILEEPESPKSTSSQETPWSTQSINSTPPLDNLLSPGWTHAITIIMGKSLKSEVGQILQKWVQYHLIHDHTDFGSPGTLRIQRTSDFSKNMQKMTVLLPIYQATLLKTL